MSANLSHEQIKQALLVAAYRRGKSAQPDAVNPYHQKSQAALHRAWEKGHKEAQGVLT